MRLWLGSEWSAARLTTGTLPGSMRRERRQRLGLLNLARPIRSITVDNPQAPSTLRGNQSHEGDLRCLRYLDASQLVVGHGRVAIVGCANKLPSAPARLSRVLPVLKLLVPAPSVGHYIVQT